MLMSHYLARCAYAHPPHGTAGTGTPSNTAQHSTAQHSTAGRTGDGVVLDVGLLADGVVEGELVHLDLSLHNQEAGGETKHARAVDRWATRLPTRMTQNRRLLADCGWPDMMEYVVTRSFASELNPQSGLVQHTA